MYACVQTLLVVTKILIGIGYKKDRLAYINYFKRSYKDLNQYKV